MTLVNLLEELHTFQMARLNRTTWITIWCVAIVVTLIGRTWSAPTSVPPNWQFDIQFPGIFVILYMGWFIGPFATMMTPPVVCILTILTNVGVYYALVKMILFARGKLRS